MALFTAFDITATGLTAERYRMDTIAENIANANTTRTADGTPYRRKVVVFETQETQQDRRSFGHVLSEVVGTGRAQLNHDRNIVSDDLIGYGVKIPKISEDEETPMNMVYDPSHPDADENGYVTYPNVNTITEMTNLIDANRAYEANATAFQASKSMATTGLNIMN
ncbi:MAG: flagellar basal body rod protein FlgC [Lachnospiraceae bacterium]|nr:flagellar basal body rod protein FlgC [Lachnospiraceae bacterium]MBO6300700.1 flagellar basal body rod protein FlgC [Lachnospiraceae bacterium]